MEYNSLSKIRFRTDMNDWLNAWMRKKGERLQKKIKNVDEMVKLDSVVGVKPVGEGSQPNRIFT